MPQISPWYARDMPKSCPRYAQDMLQICRYDWLCGGKVWLGVIINNWGHIITFLGRGFIGGDYHYLGAWLLATCIKGALSPPDPPKTRHQRKPSSICAGSLLLLPGGPQPAGRGKTRAAKLDNMWQVWADHPRKPALLLNWCHKAWERGN